jgi:hypothetical protein
MSRSRPAFPLRPASSLIFHTASICVHNPLTVETLALLSPLPVVNGQHGFPRLHPFLSRPPSCSFALPHLDLSRSASQVEESRRHSLSR